MTDQDLNLVLTVVGYLGAFLVLSYFAAAVLTWRLLKEEKKEETTPVVKPDGAHVSSWFIDEFVQSHGYLSYGLLCGLENELVKLSETDRIETGKRILESVDSYYGARPESRRLTRRQALEIICTNGLQDHQEEDATSICTTGEVTKRVAQRRRLTAMDPDATIFERRDVSKKE